MTVAADAFIGLGGNVGDPVAALRAALTAIGRLPGTRVLATSRFYRTAAWGITDQPAFVNAAARVSTMLAPRALLDGLLAIERAAGRERGTGPQWGPRVLDLDLLLYGDARIDEDGLTLPHPRLHQRAFALVPLLDVAPDLCLPGHGRIADLVATMATGDVEALG